MTHLSKDKHPQKDFFIADIFSLVSLQLDRASLEYPLFALKGGDFKTKEYQINGFSLTIAPSVQYGLATIHDKDIWIYCISKMMQAIKENNDVSRTVRFTVYDYLKSTNRAIGGQGYDQTKLSLNRLRSTTITTEIETDKIKEAEGFGLVDSWKIVEEKDGRMIRVEVTLPNWLYRSILSKSVLTISKDYFRLRKPLDRRLYELARKHCGNSENWHFLLKNLHERTGSTASLKEFKRSIKSLALSDQLPDYSIEFNEKSNIITFTNRNFIHLDNDNKPIKRKTISKKDAEKMAYPGEDWEELLTRIGKYFKVV